MHVITRKRLLEFWRKHSDSQPPLRAWLAIVRSRSYFSPYEVRRDFPSASFLGRWRTIFNIGGNKHRLIVDIRYDLGRIYIRHVLTHKEYNRRTRSGDL
ncbi:MAG: type II toxin-antitoxin system HigB family toxin [Candidatus Latescibacteria bacterium]|nr:type II toxin-antitoxin system HigB family toxin [Candidatus Latescibacterota bacterium]